MAPSVAEARAVELAARALKLDQSGQAEEVFKAVREAISLAPENTEVNEAFRLVQSKDSLHPLLRCCRTFAEGHTSSEEAGEEAVRYLASSAEVPSDVSRECLQLLLKNAKSLPLSLLDRVVTGVLRECPGARVFLAQRLSGSETVVFNELYELGDGSANALATIVLDSTAWSLEKTRESSEKDVFRLFLAKLMEAGHDHDGRALKGIARLLMSDAEKLHGLIDEQTFDAILSSQDNRLPVEVRSQATMATAKYLEASPTDAQKFLLNFIQIRVARQKSEDLILAFCAAAAVFPLVPSIASSFFLAQGFLPSLVPLLQKRVKSERVEQAALELLSSACLDKACRQAIEKHCKPWLEQVVNGESQKSSGLATVILAKMSTVVSTDGHTKQNENSGDVSMDIVRRMKEMIIDPDSSTKDASIEGLAYASTQPNIKEEIVKDTKFLKKLVHRLDNLQAKDKLPHDSSIAFGILTILDNLARYLPTLSEEQKKLSQLKAYANASPSRTEQSPLDSEDAVKERCTILTLVVPVVPVLARSHKYFTPTATTLMLSILLSLSRNPFRTNRGQLAQQGAAKLLLQTYTSISGASLEDQLSRYTASYALARILISVNPSLIFPSSGSPPLSSTIRPLISLLSPPPESTSNASTPRDLLPTFEALLALTNLASTPDPQIADQITRLATAEIDEHLLANNARIRRAATELCCNLTSSPSGIALFACPTAAARRRIHILLALSDSEDVATRRGAGGALAGILVSEGGVRNVLDRDRGVERLIGLVEDADEECARRGLVALGNMSNTDEGREKILALGGFEKVKEVVEAMTGNVKELGEEVLQVLAIRAVDVMD